jgi:hypothetical protein
MDDDPGRMGATKSPGPLFAEPSFTMRRLEVIWALRVCSTAGFDRLTLLLATVELVVCTALTWRAFRAKAGIARVSMAYLPTQQACRFPRNAEMPSWASAAREFMLITSLA